MLVAGIRRLPHLPDVFARERASPLERRVVDVCRVGVLRRPELDQVLDQESVRAEEPDPVAVRELELGRSPLGILRVRTTQSEVVVQQLAAGRLVLASAVGQAARVLPTDMLVPYIGESDPMYSARDG